jgi:ABC-2 type transport system permease protein
VLTGTVGTVTLAYGLGVAAAGVTYAALFLALSVITRNAVVVGLIYALIWETLVGGLVPGAQALSVQQWSLAMVEQALGGSASTLGVSSAVDFSTALVLLLLVSVGSTAYAGRRLQTLRLNDES